MLYDLLSHKKPWSFQLELLACVFWRSQPLSKKSSCLETTTLCGKPKLVTRGGQEAQTASNWPSWDGSKAVVNDQSSWAFWSSAPAAVWFSPHDKLQSRPPSQAQSTLRWTDNRRGQWHKPGNTPASLSVCLTHTEKTALGEGTTWGTFRCNWHIPPTHTPNLLGFFFL